MRATGRRSATGPEGATATSDLKRNSRGAATDYLTAF